MTATDYEALPALAEEAPAPSAGTVVMKFGGTSVADVDRLRAVAQRLVAAREAGNRVVAVLSAMGDTTDELVRLAHEMSPRPKARELDMLISVGERISCSLCAMAIHDLGHEAISLTGSQAGIVTDTAHGKAKIVDIRANRIHEALDKERIVLVAGFQGVSTDLDITTLGRGGSDTTAVALAAALGADACEIYTDVEGVHTADPRIVTQARKLHAVSYGEMLEMAASGARVLQLRSVEFARNHDVKLHVRSSFSEADGTWIREEDERMLEKALISGVTHKAAETVYRVEGVSAARLFDALAEAGVNVDTVIQTGVGDRLLRRRGAGGRGRARESRRRMVGARGSGPGERDRRRDEEPPRSSREDVLRARGARDPAGDRHHLADQNRLLRRARPGRAGRSGAACRVRARAPGSGAPAWLSRGSASSGQPEPSGRSRSRCWRSAGFGQVRAFASSRSAGTTVPFGGSELEVEEATKEALGSGELDLCFFSVGTEPSSELVPAAVAGGAVCVDKSSAFRLTDGVPLVVPEVNGDRAAAHEGIVANPNCSTIQLVCALAPLHEAAGLRSVRVATYQSASGAGAERMEAAPLAAVQPTATSSWTGTSRATSLEEESKLRAETQEDPRAARPPVQRHVRPRARPRRPLAGGLGRDGGAAVAGRGPRRSERPRPA